MFAATCIFGACALSASALPDGRVYELVSPAQKSGGIGGVFPLAGLIYSRAQLGRPMQSAANGAGIAYLGEDFYQPRLGSLNEYLSQQGPEGWTTQNLTPATLSTSEVAQEANLHAGFSPDLSIGVLSSPDRLAENAPVGYANLYLTSGGVRLQSLLTAKPPHRAPGKFGYAFVRELSQEPAVEHHLLFAGGNAGTVSVAPFSHVLLEANDALTPDAIDGGEFANNLYDWKEGQLHLVNVLPDGTPAPKASFGVDNEDRYGLVPVPNLERVISADGSRIFWTDENNHNLYVRENGERTVQVDADPSVGGGGRFQTASTDGSRVFFTKMGRLFEYDTADRVTHELAGSGVLGVLDASGDGSCIYFVSTSVLASGAEAGRPNLYVSREGVLATIATLSPEDDKMNALELYGGSNTPEGDWYRTFAGRTAEVSPSGRYLAFLSRRSLTGYDNLDEGTPLYEIYVYDATTETLACASCNTDGSPPTHNSMLPISANGIYQQRYIENAGRLFFSTSEPVLPEDVNERSDVYEYANGHVALISSGSTSNDAVFADASESGGDLFFTTRKQLVPGDTDQVVDMYDARIDGTPEALPPPGCTGEVCREALISPPAVSAPVSSVFVGAGNAAPPSPPQPSSEPRRLTRAQLLSRALKACRVKRDRHRRGLCESRAKRRYR